MPPQVSRLLEYAAAMSSAQEAVTGSGKLDMAGVMAALALARQEEAGKAGRGQKSFLHNNFNKSSAGLLVRAEPLQTEVEVPVKTVGGVGGRRKEESGGLANIVKSYNESPAGKCAKTISTASIKLSGPVESPVQSPAEQSGRKKVSECRAAFESMSSNGLSSSASSLESSPRQDKKWSGSVSSRQTNNECESSSQTSSQTSEKQTRNTTERNTERNAESPRTSTTNLANIDMANMTNMAGFLAMVEKLSEEKERRTGSGRLDMSELVSALTNFQSTSRAPTPTSPPPLPARPPPRSPGSPPCPPPPPPTTTVSAASLSGRGSTQPQHSQTTNKTKSSFLQSQLKQNTEKQVQNQHATPNTKTSYTQEKNSLLGELKSKLNKENTIIGDGKQSLPRRNLEVANPSQDQIVNKIVYNQYREMLNSYRNNK